MLASSTVLHALAMRTHIEHAHVMHTLAVYAYTMEYMFYIGTTVTFQLFMSGENLFNNSIPTHTVRCQNCSEGWPVAKMNSNMPTIAIGTIVPCSMPPKCKIMR